MYMTLQDEEIIAHIEDLCEVACECVGVIWGWGVGWGVGGGACGDEVE